MIRDGLKVLTGAIRKVLRGKRKLRHIRRDDWVRFTETRYSRERITLFGRETEAQLMHILHCERPYAVGGNVIGDTGYTWLQLAPKGGLWWMTAMYRPDGTAVQYYFDITAGNEVSGGKDAAFEDRYLDVVLEPDGTYRVLDADELDAALRRGDITAADHEKAHSALNALLPLLTRENISRFDAIREKLLETEPKTWAQL